MSLPRQAEASLRSLHTLVCCTSSRHLPSWDRTALVLASFQAAGLDLWQLSRATLLDLPGRTCRYPDVVVHRLLAAAIAKGAAGTKGKPPAEPCLKTPDSEAARWLHVLRHNFSPCLTDGLRTGQQLSWQGARPPVRRAVCRVFLAVCCPASAACRVPHATPATHQHVCLSHAMPAGAEAVLAEGDSMKETVRAGAQPQEESAEDAGVAQQHHLMHQEMVSAISEHANDRKFAAKNAQVCLHGARHVLVSLSSFSSVLCCCVHEGARMHLLQIGLAWPSRLPLWACGCKPLSTWNGLGLAGHRYSHESGLFKASSAIGSPVMCLTAMGLTPADAGRLSQSRAALAAQHASPKLSLCVMPACNPHQQDCAAPAVQDASLKLYLCVMLRLHPRVCEAVMLQLGGPRFMDLYVPEFGVEVRIQVAEMLPAPVHGEWSPATK